MNVIFKGFKNPKADKTQDSNVATYTVLDIFKSCRLTTFALMMCFVWYKYFTWSKYIYRIN